jgi:hypothetical protein
MASHRLSVRPDWITLRSSLHSLQVMARQATRRSLLIAALLLCADASDSFGQADSIDRDVKAAPGRDVRVGIYTSVRPDCTAGPLPSIRLAVAPEHGTIAVRRAMLKATNLKQCLGIDVPAFVAIYRAQQDFNGDDRFDLEVNFSAGRKQTQHFHVTVSNTANPTNGPRI